jgi:hypothetical protein
VTSRLGTGKPLTFFYSVAEVFGKAVRFYAGHVSLAGTSSEAAFVVGN